ncbi:MAG: TonB-dependent receptor [Ferruginibacter sp.]
MLNVAMPATSGAIFVPLSLGRKGNVTKILLIMKLMAILLMAGALQVSASGYGQKITLSVTNTPLQKVFSEIEKQTGYYFAYTSELLKASVPVSLTVHDATLNDVLDKLLKNQPLSYTITDKVISVRQLTTTAVHFLGSVVAAPAPANIITGTVTNGKGEPLPGVSVVVKGSAGGTATDRQGEYAIDVPHGATIQFSYVGFVTKEVLAGSQATINIVLEEQLSNMDQVVVVGYGTQKKKDLTGSIGTVSAGDIGELAVVRPDQALAGKVAGVQAKIVSGQPGAAAQIRIRGIGSISAGADPLYVVDGFPIDNIQSISPADIETMDILKDAAATAIYGSRGANGVVIINTKRGKVGPPVVNIDASYGLQSITRIVKTMNAKQLSQYAVDALRNKNLDAGEDVSGDPSTWTYPVQPIPLAVLAGTNTTDNQMIKQLLRTAPVRHFSASASGGTENIKYAISTEYLNQDGIIKNSDFTRYSIRANVDAKLTKRLTVKMSLSPTYSQSNLTDESTSASYNAYISESPINRAQLWPTNFPAKNPDGSYYQYESSAASPAWNPLAWIENVTNKQKAMRLLGNISAEYKITDGLLFKALVGATMYNTKAMRFEPSLVALGGDGDGAPNIAVGTDNSVTEVNWLTEYTLNYNKLVGKHAFSSVAGYTAQKDRFESSFLTSNLYPNNLVQTLSAVGGRLTGGSADISEWSLISYLLRVNYNYDSKYYITASIRSDGSSRFGSASKYGQFPSVALAWRVSQEKFLKGASFLNELKLRVSYGQTGNNNIGNYQQYATINYNRYVIGGTAATGYSPAQLSNPLLTWEKQKAFNVGADISVLDKRVNVTVDYFKSRNTDLLLNVNIPVITGFYNTLKNIGEVQNTGLEFSVNTVNIRTKDFQWSTDLNISTYRNKVVKLGPGGDPIYSASNITEVGQPIGMFYGFLTNGVYLSQADVDKSPIFGEGTSVASRPGDVKYIDVNGDGKIDNSDQTVMGNPYPKVNYGMTNHLSWKAFTFSTTLQGAQGGKILNMSAIGQENTRGNRVSQLASQLNYWKSEAEPGDGKTPRPNDAVKGNNRAVSQRYLDNASFLRITNIYLACSLPQTIASRLSFSSIRVYASASNAFTFTKNTSSFNPDVSNSGNPLNPGVDFNDYPLPKTFLLGINIGL